MINYILSKSNIMINYIGFTIVWFSCVYSGAKGDPIIALIPTFIFLFLHFLIQSLKCSIFPARQCVCLALAFLSLDAPMQLVLGLVKGMVVLKPLNEYMR